MTLRRGRDIVLLPKNAKYASIVVDPRTTAFAIEGIAVGLIRGNGKRQRTCDARGTQALVLFQP